MKKNLIKLSAGFLLSIFVLPCTALSKGSDFSFAEKDDDFFSLTYQAEEKDEELETLVARKKKKNDDSSTNEEGEISSDSKNADSLVEEKKDEDTKSKSKNQKTEVKKVEPSRSITLNKNQELEVTYPGQGWIYLGEMNNTNLLRYAGRSLGQENTVFNLRTRNEGKTLLHFYKNDVLASSYIDDYLEVIVTSDASSGEKVTAPAYEEIIPASPSIYANKDKPSKEEKFVEITNEALTISSFIPKEEPPAEEAASIEEGTAGTDGGSGQETAVQTEAKTAEGTADVKEEGSASEEKTSPSVTEEANVQNQNGQSANDLTPASDDTKKEDTASNEVSSSNQSGENQNAGEQAAAENPSQENQNAEEESAGESPAVQEEVPEQPLQGSLDAIMGASSSIVEDDLAKESPDTLLKDAESAYKRKEYDKALSYLREFFNKATSDFDKALYLQGQCYEANSSLRDIQAALDSYQALVKNYPSSEKWQDANNRIFYINRFYFGHF